MTFFSPGRAAAAARRARGRGTAVRLLAAALVAAGAAAANIAPAGASAAIPSLPTASISRTIFLTGAPTTANTATLPNAGARSISLATTVAPGDYRITYSFTHGPAGSGTVSESETLSIKTAGTYSWICRIAGLADQSGLANYATECTLSGPSGTFRIPAASAEHVLLNQGTWTWTSTLVPLFAQ
jgi:hypothetical protein